MYTCKCGTSVPPSSRECPGCGRDAGFPNVRAAQTPAEKTALDGRLASAEVSAAAGGYKAVLDSFGEAMNSSFAVIARPLPVIEHILLNERAIYTSYHQQLAEGARLPEDNEYDKYRESVDSMLFSGYYKYIRFGCLSLSADSAREYGDYAMVLKEEMIAHRASVFEENPFEFVKRHRLIATTPIPFGFRAEWERRSVLARAKLYPELTASSTESAFPRILLGTSRTTSLSDFIEVHIYGPISRATVARLVGAQPSTREDRTVWKSLQRKLPSLGIQVDVI